MLKEKKKEETERERMERLNREYNDIDWVGLYNSDKLSSLRVDELSLYFSHHKIPFKGKKAEKVAMIKAHIGSLLYDSMGRQHPRKSPLRNVQQQVSTSSFSEVETDSQSDVVDRVFFFFFFFFFFTQQGPFTQEIFVAATRCNLRRAKIASSFKHVRNPCDTAAANRTKNRTWFTRALLKLQPERDKNCMELPRQKSPV